MTVAFHLPLRLVPQVNAREHWRKTAARKSVQKLTTHAIGRAAMARSVALAPPYRVQIVRVGPRRMDLDNAIGAAKHVRDAVAALLGVDDGDEARITFDYGRKIGPFGVDIVIEGCATVPVRHLGSNVGAAIASLVTGDWESKNMSDLQKIRTMKLTLTNDERARLLAAVKEHGVSKVVKWIGVSREAVTRAAAGFPVRKGTLVVIRAATFDRDPAPGPEVA